MTTTNGTARTLLPDGVQARYKDLIVGANAGDQRAARDLLALCEEHPILWQKFHDLQAQAELTWLEVITPDAKTDRDRIARRMFQEGAQERRRELLADGASPLETLLIDRIISAYYQVTYCEMKYTQCLGEPGCTSERAEFHQKTAERAQRQLLRAVQGLATVRRLIGPVQLNVGMNQLNVVANGASHP